MVLVVRSPPANASRHKRREFDPWVEKTPQRRARPPTPGFLLGNFHGQRRLWAAVHRVAQSHQTRLKRLSTHV